MLKILGVGLPRTGTRSLCAALGDLGFVVDRDAPAAIDVRKLRTLESFRLFDHLEATVEPVFWREIHHLYQPKLILTTRDPASWWRSAHKHHYDALRTKGEKDVPMKAGLHFGTAEPNEYIWRKRMKEHAEHVQLTCLADGIPLLTMDVRQGWLPLCEFLDVPIPATSFPQIR